MNLRSYRSAAISTTKIEPVLCTIAPVLGVSKPREDKIIATRLIVIDREMLNFIVFSVARARMHRYGSFSMSSSMRAIPAASVAMSLPTPLMAMLIFAVFNAGASFTPSPIIHTLYPCFCNCSTAATLSCGKSFCKAERRDHSHRNEQCTRYPALFYQSVQGEI